ncbi:MAG TPA: hypothetical protein VMH02_07530 [Verrucomicrobiae bacterium]|nr:hypothetical protein [Verrucomicrobiae bacterium]
MRLQYRYDRVFASRGWRTQPFTVLRGADLTVSGWAAGGGTVPAVLEAIVDGVTLATGACGLARPDVAAALDDEGALRAGFTITLPTQGLAAGVHALALQFTLTDGSVERTAPLAMTVYTADVELPACSDRPRAIVAAAPKSGGTYATAVLLRYYGIENPPFAYEYRQEHALTDRLLRDLGDRPFVVHLHLPARAQTVEALKQFGIAPIVGWRNLADTVVSYDDHVRNEGTETAAGTFVYINERERYLAMPRGARYRFLVRHMLPWYVAFYLGWRDVRAPLWGHYEELVADPLAYFGRIAQALSGHVDRERLRASLSQPAEQTRFNAGRNGRALELMDEETQAFLEAALRDHYADLAPLIDELPWRSPPAHLQPRA